MLRLFLELTVVKEIEVSPVARANLVCLSAQALQAEKERKETMGTLGRREAMDHQGRKEPKVQAGRSTHDSQNHEFACFCLIV